MYVGVEKTHLGVGKYLAQFRRETSGLGLGLTAKNHTPVDEAAITTSRDIIRCAWLASVPPSRTLSLETKRKV